MLKQLFFWPCLLLTFMANAQNVAINNDNTAPDASAILDLKSTAKGVLIPRMNLSQRNLISLPAPYLLIYQTDNTPGFYYNTGTTVAPVWQLMGATGPQGPQGIPGPQGPAGGGEYAFTFSTTSVVVSAASSVPFITNGPISSNISHTAGTSTIVVNIAGTYKIEYQAFPNAAAIFAVTSNGITLPGSRVASSAAGWLNGMVIANLNAGDIVQLRNDGATMAFLLPADPGAISASILITKL